MVIGLKSAGLAKDGSFLLWRTSAPGGAGLSAQIGAIWLRVERPANKIDPASGHTGRKAIAMRLLIVGATGLVGRHALELALADPRIAAVTAPARRPLPDHPKLSARVVDFEDLPEDASFWETDAVICALGTTIRTAGSQDAFRRVDHGYPLAVARLAHERGAQTFALNSALGADPESRIFYSRVKGELERDLAGVGFRSLAFVRPGLIGGQRDETRPAERVASVILGAFGPMLPRGWRINPARNIAAALIDAAVATTPGVHVVASRDLV
jgi:uncharacterized protein YbjT (DUF2867 family)